MNVRSCKNLKFQIYGYLELISYFCKMKRDNKKRKLDLEKVNKLSSANDMLDTKYGKLGSESRAEFDAQALTWYYGNLIRSRRKELKLTQREVAEKIGREQTYIARVEKGKTDLQLSSFFRIAAVLGIQLVPSFVSALK